MPPENPRRHPSGEGNVVRPDPLLPEGVYNPAEYSATPEDIRNMLERQFRLVIRMQMGVDRWLPQMKGYAKKHEQAIARYKQENYPDGQVPPVEIEEQKTS